MKTTEVTDIKDSNEIEVEKLEDTPKGSKKSPLNSPFLIVGILIVMAAFLTFMSSQFLTVNNILNLLTQSSIFGILAFSAQLAITSKGIDISLGSILAFSGIVAGVMSQRPEAIDKIIEGFPMMPIWATVLIAIIVGGLIGTVNGTLISRFALPAFIATLGSQIVFRGGALMISGGRPVSNINPHINFFGSRIGGWLPVPVLTYILVIIFMHILMNYTSFGKSVYAIGGNIEAANVSGIKVKRNLTLVYSLSGALAGLAAIVFMGRTGGSMQPAAAVGFETTAIAATTIGGTSHGGGISTVWGTVVGALILGVITNGFTLLGINAYIQQIVQGLIIVGAVIIDMRRNK